MGSSVEAQERRRTSNRDAMRRRQTTPEGRRANLDALLRYKYGIGVDEYEALLTAQDNRCAICQKPASERKRALNVDHDHATDKVRGLLCSWCNWFVGRMEEPGLLAAATEYLEESI